MKVCVFSSVVVALKECKREISDDKVVADAACFAGGGSSRGADGRAFDSGGGNPGEYFCRQSQSGRGSGAEFDVYAGHRADYEPELRGLSPSGRSGPVHPRVLQGHAETGATDRAGHVETPHAALEGRSAWRVSGRAATNGRANSHHTRVGETGREGGQTCRLATRPEVC